MITVEQFNDGMTHMIGAFGCTYQPDVEMEYWNAVQGWSPDLWRDVVRRLCQTHKFKSLPSLAQLEEARKGYRPAEDTGAKEWVPIGTPLGMLTTNSQAGMFRLVAARYQDSNVTFCVKRSDFMFEVDWKKLLDRHGLSRETEVFYPSECECGWCKEHNRGKHCDLDLPFMNRPEYELSKNCMCEWCKKWKVGGYRIEHGRT